MNKQELKSLLENIYRTLTQEGIIPPPPLGTGSEQWPTQWPDVAPPPPPPSKPPVVTPPILTLDQRIERQLQRIRWLQDHNGDEGWGEPEDPHYLDKEINILNDLIKQWEIEQQPALG